MNKHYLLLVHDQPAHVARLIERLDDGCSAFWVHIDRRVDQHEWSVVARLPSVHLVEPRVACVWGTWGMVEATLAMMRSAVASGREGTLVLLSGQSYPLCPRDAIDALLTKSAEQVRMDIWPLEQHWPDNYRDRLDYFCIPLSHAKGDLALLRPRREMDLRELFGWSRRLRREMGIRDAIRILRVIGSDRPDPPARPVGGSQWWSMPWVVAEEVLLAHDHRAETAAYFRWSQYPDESYFQTLVSIVDPGLVESALPGTTFVDWTAGDGEVPRVLVASDVARLLTLPDTTIFARKFRPGASAEAMAIIDLERLGLPAQGPA